MFKKDQKTLEELSFYFNENELSNFKKTIKHLKSKELLTLPTEEIQQVLKSLDKIAELKLDKKVYAFSTSYYENGDFVYDSELYIRQGNTLKEFFTLSEDNGHYCDDEDDDLEHFEFDYLEDEPFFLLNYEKMFEKLKENNITKVYTGSIPRDKVFLGLPYERFDHNFGNLTINCLIEEHLSKFLENKIKVIKLDYLV
jgi:hypothetical protein